MSRLDGELRRVQSDMDALLERVLLLPSQFQVWREVLTFAERRRVQLDVYRREVAALHANKYPAEGYGALVVSGQPFPDVIKQKEKKRTKAQVTHSDEQLQVTLLVPARSSLVPVGSIKAELVWQNDKDQDKKGSSSVLNGEAKLAKKGAVATFDELRFSKVEAAAAYLVSLPSDANTARGLA